MLRIALISAVILPLLLWFAFQAKTKNQSLVSTSLFTIAGIYSLLLIASFFGFIAG